MGTAVVQDGWFADAQELRFQAVKRSDIENPFMQVARFSDAQE